VERFSDPATDATLVKLGATTDEATQKTLVGNLVETMMTQFPVTPLIYAPARLVYRTTKAVGWPSEQDPYAHPVDDKLIILTHLIAP
jgi:peptide/nickel transport system substrate-binding protein